MTIVTADPKYPVGRFTPIDPSTAAIRGAAIDDIAALPVRVREAVAGLSDAQLDTPYREGGWAVRQVVHHVADSHVNAYVRLKLALTEAEPTIKPYDENTWAALADSCLPLAPSLGILDGLHERWAILLRSLNAAQFERRLRHPEYPDRVLTVDWITQLYAWHSRHHVAHVTTLRAAKGW